MKEKEKEITCVYCGYSFPSGTPSHGAEILKKHIKKCEKHPLRAAEKRIKELEVKLEEKKYDYDNIKMLFDIWANPIDFSCDEIPEDVFKAQAWSSFYLVFKLLNLCRLPEDNIKKTFPVWQLINPDGDRIIFVSEDKCEEFLSVEKDTYGEDFNRDDYEVNVVEMSAKKILSLPEYQG